MYGGDIFCILTVVVVTQLCLSKFTELYKKNADFAKKKQQKEFRVEELTEWTKLERKKTRKSEDHYWIANI